MLASTEKEDPTLEYVIVEHVDQRKVWVDGIIVGETNTTIRLEAGAHEFSLEPPSKSGSKTMLKIVKGTSAMNPIRINFDDA